MRYENSDNHNPDKCWDLNSRPLKIRDKAGIHVQ